MEIKNTNTLTLEDHYLKVLAYGVSGTGKTTFASTFPKPFFIDFDQGMLSLRGKDVSYVSCTDIVRNGVLVSHGCDEADKAFDEVLESPDFNTIIVDSITTYQASMLEKVLKTNNKTIPGILEYGLRIKALQNLFMKLRAVPKHVVIIAHEQVVKDELLGGVLIQPLVSGDKLPQQLPLYFDEVYRFVVRQTTKKLEYVMFTKAGTNFTAKSRLGVLPSPMESSYEAIVKCVNNEKGGDIS